MQNRIIETWYDVLFQFALIYSVALGLGCARACVCRGEGEGEGEGFIECNGRYIMSSVVFRPIANRKIFQG